MAFQIKYRHLSLFLTIFLFPRSALNVSMLWVSQAKEIEATSEWTLLKEGDTIPAGLHIKMDLSTGEKWVKLIDKDEDKRIKEDSKINDEEEIISIVDEEGTFSAEMKPDGSVALIRNSDGTPLQQEINSDKNKKNNDMHKTEKPNYDFEMMHRTLSKLGPEEGERMELPDLPAKDASPETQKKFEERMETIWTNRQKELAKLEVADLPKILKDRIYSIQSYIQDGFISFPGLSKSDNIDHEDQSREGIYDDVGFLLEDLEDQLRDLDNARDFHTLEGWPLLVSLLSDSAHSRALKRIRNDVSNKNDTDIQFTITKDIQTRYKQSVQAAAAWAIGTAVKNVHEFFPWALEDISKLNFVSIPNSNHINQSSITVLDLLLHQFEETFACLANADNEQTLQNKNSASKLQQRIVYALGALLRLNTPAQRHFTSIDGPKILGTFLQHALFSETDPSKKIVTLSLKIISLGSDIVTEIIHDFSSNYDDSMALLEDNGSLTTVKAFTDERWCNSAPKLLQIYTEQDNIKTQENLVTIIGSLSPLCRGIWSDSPQMLVQQLLIKWKASPIDGEWKKEIVELGERVLKSFQTNE